MVSFRDYLLLEKIVGNTGWVYHRTKNNPEESDIVKYGIKPSSNQSALYGKGLYCCYDLDQQLKPKMKNYGRFILKGKIDLNGFAILDEDVFRLANPRGDFEKHLKEIGTSLMEAKDRSILPYTSRIAQRIWKKCKQNGYNGIVFTGESDGKVSVIWNRRNFIPYQYSKDDGENWEKLNPDISSIKRKEDAEYDKDDEFIKFSKILRELSNKQEIGDLKAPHDYNGIVFLKKIQKSGNIDIHMASKINLPQLQISGNIGGQFAREINLPNLQISGFINAPHARELNLPQLQKSGDIYIHGVSEINLPQLRESGNIHAEIVKKLNLPELQTSGDIWAYAATELNLPKLRESGGDIDIREASKINLPQLQISGSVYTNSATELNMPQLQISRNISANNATELNMPQLRISGGIYADSATELNLPKLQQQSGGILARNATEINFPELQKSGSIEAANATELNLPQLKLSGYINARNAKKIIIPKHLKEKLINVPSECEIIHPEDAPEIKVNENVTFKKYLMLKESLVQIPLDTAYEIFKKEYDKSTGSSWSRDKFMGRARAWEFYGDNNGYVAIRRQRSGLVKLVGMAGDNRSKLKGINDLVSMNLPLWGMVSKEIKDIAVRRGMREPNFLERQVLKRSIPPEVLGGAEILEYQKDGGIKLQYPDVGVVIKYLVGTSQYYAKLRELFGDKLKEKILG